MTLTVRNGLLALALGLVLVLVAAWGLLAFVLVMDEGWTAVVGDSSLGQLLLSSLWAPAGSLVGFLVVRRAYRKSAAPEDFFFALFLTTFAGESLALAQAWVVLHDLPSYDTAILTRVVWGFRLAGLGLLLCSSLFALSFTYRRFGNLVLGSVVTGAFLATILPLHSTVDRADRLVSLGDTAGLVLVATLVGTVVLVNFILAARRPGAPERAWARAWAAGFYVAGWSLTVVWAPWGLLLTVPGLVLTAWKAEQNSLN